MYGVYGKDILLEEGEMLPIREDIAPVAGEDDLPFYFGGEETGGAVRSEEPAQAEETAQTEETKQKPYTDRCTCS